MQVREYMITSVTTLTDEVHLLDAALLIRRTGKRHVPVVSAKSGKVLGIVSDRDVLRLAPSMLSHQTEDEYNEIFEKTPITVAMTKDPITVTPDTPMVEAVRILHDKKIGAIIVAEDGELKGILTVIDLLGLLNELLSGGMESKSLGD